VERVPAKGRNTDDEQVVARGMTAAGLKRLAPPDPGPKRNVLRPHQSDSYPSEQHRTVSTVDNPERDSTRRRTVEQQPNPLTRAMA